MSNLNLRINTAKTICWVTVLSDALPATAGTTLTDVTHAKAGSTETADGVSDHPENHVLYHDIQDALYRQQGIQNMQGISIVPSGALAAEYLSGAALTVAAAATVQAVVKYQPADVTGVAEDFTYVSSDETKATVAATGVVTGVAAGEAVITATHKHTGQTVAIPVTVTA